MYLTPKVGLTKTVRKTQGFFYEVNIRRKNENS